MRYASSHDLLPETTHSLSRAHPLRVPPDVLCMTVSEGHSIVAKKYPPVFVRDEDDEPVVPTKEEAEFAAEHERLRRDIVFCVTRAMVEVACDREAWRLTVEDGLTVLVVPGREWVPRIRDYLRFVRKKDGPSNGKKKAEGDWAFVEVSGRVGCDALGRMGDALGWKQPVVVVAYDPDRIPKEVQAAADRVIVIPPPTWRMVHYAAVVCYEWVHRAPRPLWTSDGQNPALLETLVSPRLLALCHRPGQRAYDFCSRLARVLNEMKPSDAPSQRGRSGPQGLARVPGIGSEIEGWARCLVRDLQLFKRGALPWSEVDRGALLFGPPGTGKTTFASALAEEAGVPLVICGHGVWQEKGHQGDMLRAMRASFAEARAQAPALLFIDEMDSFPPRGSGRRDHDAYTRQVVNALLAEMDGIGTREGVVIIAACNDATMVDPALVRAGRLDHRFEMSLPARTSIEAILRVHLRHELRDEPLADIAAIAHGMSGAELEAAVRAARKAARLYGRPMRRGDLLVAVSEARGIELTAPGAMVH